MAGHLAAKLDDVFAEIGLLRVDAVGFKMVVDSAFLGDHRLALVDGCGVGVLADLQHDPAGVLGCLGPVDMAAMARTLSS